MLYSINNLTRMVRVYIDRHPESHHLIGRHDTETLDLDYVIRSHIEAAAEYVYSLAPPQIIAEAAVDMEIDDVYWHHRIGDLYQGHLLLPRDFLRLSVFEMSDWQRPVFSPINPAMPEYDMASSPFSGVCGTPYRPVCALSESSEGQVLELFSCTTDQAEVAQAKYVPRPMIDHDHIDLSRRSIGYVVHAIGVRTLITIGETEKAQQLLNSSPYTLT